MSEGVGGYLASVRAISIFDVLCSCVVGCAVYVYLSTYHAKAMDESMRCLNYRTLFFY